ncbi:acyl-CoA dehydrogenase [Lutimaribacter sp. EGI FJ00015]|uniref:Acyl-CoA dehydrogenase n=1 Tax=Lutimaribacter degradans TaxID=2945989 RepID=A0ACC5ZUP0_9RHOB|nr:acyl-CoA dehydrogenase [Lutimaribacter sp. EGI FJ00013]MCM2561560.1 acyl-CoA dehydrogenase [Lutimaribacter sp. EGI FJ00013]MCO0612729.1 acyl-CoA dehydrogenase [Lutimaribacter sp. EGI FJ00015]MCO0635387.1 acyl-CoA dehydrogenase [Lutimaribacter sp. EGI FJ00014]
MPYRAPINDFRFIFENVSEFSQVQATDRFADATPDMVEAILEGAGRICEDVLAPLRRAGDLQPARLENGVVRTSDGFKEAFAQLAEGGWIALSAGQEHGGMGLPIAITTVFNEMAASTAMSLGLCPLLTQGQVEALEHHASDEIKATYLPKLIGGEWTGTMNLTEPQAGSDVGALKTKAEPRDDGTYAISGQKIYITFGDHDLTENVCHLVLARLPDAPAGTKGISLFMVPKFIPDAEGKPGVANNLKVVSLEHKMGIHGSPTAVMQYDGATGWLVGEENKGMAAMFTMMNNARLAVGAQGVGCAEGAYQHALAYATDRQQMGRIVDHADVRRMLLTMKADTFAARAIAVNCAVAIDMETATHDPDWKARAALLTPIAKAFATDVGCDVASIGIQVHGGMGYVEETGAAQFLRDARITPIYEGTNGIQAMDLVGRKMMDGGEAAFRLLDEIQAHAESVRNDLAEPVWQASETLREAVEWLVAEGDMRARFAGSVPFLRAFARVLGGHYHLRAALAEQGEGARTKLARFYIARLLPEHAALLTHAMSGADDLFALSEDELAA